MCTDLDVLLSDVGESLDDIRADPESAYERLLDRHLQRETPINSELGEIEARYISQSQERKYRYGHRVVGNVLLGLERVVTREQLDAIWQRLLTSTR